MWKERLHASLGRLRDEDVLDLGATNADWKATLLQERRYSRIFLVRPPEPQRLRLQHRVGSDRLVLKLYHAIQAERRQREFDDLQRVWAVCGEPLRGSVVRPVTVHADLGALWTVCVEGEPGSDVVRRAFSPVFGFRRARREREERRGRELCAGAGHWLRRFQEAQPLLHDMASPHLATAADFEAYVDVRLQRMQAPPFALHDSWRGRARRVLRQALGPQEHRLHTCVWSHSDFGPHNLLWSDAPGRLAVLDFELLPQHPWFDAAYWVETLAAYPADVAWRRQAMIEAFLAAYGLEGDEPLFLALRLRHLVCTAASLRQRRTRLRLLHWPQYGGLRRRLHALVERLETARTAASSRPTQSA